ELKKQYNELNEQNNEYFIQVQAYKNSLKTLEKQKRVLQQNQFVSQALLLRTGKVNIPPVRPQPVPTGKPKASTLFPTGKPKVSTPVPTGKPKVSTPVPTGKPKVSTPVLSGRPNRPFSSSY
nr:hypothetical protein [Tanacetum cinerariifolium]